MIIGEANSQSSGAAMKPLLFILAATALAGCATTPVAAPPQVITVTKLRYVPMPAADLLPCKVATGQILTGADVVSAWQRTLAALAVCNSQISDLKHLNVTHSGP